MQRHRTGFLRSQDKFPSFVPQASYKDRYSCTDLLMLDWSWQLVYGPLNVRHNLRREFQKDCN